MSDPLESFSQLLADVVLPNLQAVQATQSEQIAANNRLMLAIEELRMHLDAQFAHLAAQLTACRAELAATQAVLKAVRAGGTSAPDSSKLVH
jgi:hypothetical protein